MATSEFLTKAEISEITGKRAHKLQIAELQYLGIPYRVRQDGTPLVHRSDLPMLRNESSKPADVNLNLNAI